MALLPGWERAVIPLAKLERFALDSANTRAKERWTGFAPLGYDTFTEGGRRSGARDIEEQIRTSLPAEVTREEVTPWGHRRITNAVITGPSGRQATLVLVWQYDGDGDVPRLITLWSRVHGGEAT